MPTNQLIQHRGGPSKRAVFWVWRPYSSFSNIHFRSQPFFLKSVVELFEYYLPLKSFKNFFFKWNKTFSPSTIILSNHSVSAVSLTSFYKKKKHKNVQKKIAQSIFVKAFSSQLTLILSKVRRYICDIYDHHHHRYCHLPSNKHHQTQLCFEIKM